MIFRKNLLLRNLLKTCGILDLVIDYFWRASHLQDEIKYKKFKKNIDWEKASKEITAVVLTVGKSRFVEKCIQSIQMQTLPPIDIKIIKDVSPFSKASQKGLESVNTPYYISVDEDMILKPHCFEKLYWYTAFDDECGETVMRLKDPILDRIWGIHMYRVSAARKIGFHPLTGEKGCERRMTISLQNKGYKTKKIDLLAGLHHPIYSPEDIFWKYRFIGEKYIYYYSKNSGDAILIESLSRLSEFWLSTRSSLVIYAMAGLLDGMQSNSPSMQLNYKERDYSITLEKLKATLSMNNIDHQYK